MRFSARAVFVPLLASLSLAAAAHPALAQTCTKQFQMVGFSSRTLNGNAGVFGMTAACQESFAASRMCTSEEVMNTVTIPDLNAQNAWVRPAIKPIGTGGGAVIADASGSDSADGNANSLPGDLTCRGWTRTNNYNGLTVNDSGGFLPQSCSGSRPVACCSLIPVPEPPLAAIQGGAMAALASLSALKGTVRNAGWVRHAAAARKAARAEAPTPVLSCEEGAPAPAPEPGEDAIAS